MRITLGETPIPAEAKVAEGLTFVTYSFLANLLRLQRMRSLRVRLLALSALAWATVVARLAPAPLSTPRSLAARATVAGIPALLKRP